MFTPVRKSNSSKLRFETLEGRMMLSASPIVKLDHSTLVIQGTNGQDIVDVSYVGTNYVVTASFNGGANQVTTIPVASVRNIKIELKGGDDILTMGTPSFIADVTTIGVPGMVTTPAFVAAFGLRGELTIDMGAGNDVMNLGAMAIAGKTKITTGAGADTVDLALSAFQRDLVIETGDGPDLVGLEGLWVWGNAEVKTGGGDDFVAALGLTIGNRFSVDTAKGNDEVDVILNATEIGDVAASLTTYLTTNSAAFFTLLDQFQQNPPITVAEEITALVAEFQTTFTNISDFINANAAVPASIIAKNVKIETGDGADIVEVANALVYNELNVDLGRGNDQLYFGDNTYGKATLDGDSGYDTLSFFGTNTATHGHTKIKHFENITGTIPA